MNEAAKRDEALDLLARTRATLIEQAFRLAHGIASVSGTVTSTEVLAKMRQLDLIPEGIDTRFMGPVFRRKCWKPVGWEDSGSHCRPVRRWRLR